MTGISVALATYQGGRFLAEQLESLERQSLPPAELVVTDDGSTDATLEHLERFAARASFPVRIHRNDRRLGYRANFVRAAGFARSDLIAFCDQDDVWEPRKLEVMAGLFHDPEVLLGYHDATVVDESGYPLGRLFRRGARRRSWEPLSLDPWALVLGFTQVFRRSLMAHAHLQPDSMDPYWPEEPLAHDQFFLFLASVLGRVVRIPNRLVRYRQHSAAAFGWSGKGRDEAPSRFLVQGSSFLRAAENRLDLLDRLDVADGGRVQAAHARYRSIVAVLAQRRELFNAPGPGARLRAMAGLIREGAYRHRSASGGLGWEGLVVDAFLGVPLGARASGYLEVP